VDDGYRIELFVFPDGTSVEMIVFAGDRDRRCGDDCVTQETARPGERDDAPRTGALSPAPCRVPPPDDDGTALSACPVCGGRLVYPVDWERGGEAAWDITLRCPECETHREVTLGRAAVERFNRDLYRGAQALAREAERLIRRNFEDEVERIASALEQDLILPMDF
jgi:hypothetical protein